MANAAVVFIAVPPTRLFRFAIGRADGHIYGQGGAAELLGINPTTLASRLRALKITATKAR